MNRYFVLSGGLHITLAILVILLLNPVKKDSQATYTIDFIGSGKVIAMQASAKPSAAPKAQVAKETAPAPAKPAETKKSAQKAYDSKAEIAKKPAKSKVTPAPAPLAAPSILDDTETNEQTAASLGNEGEFEGGNIQTDFATFPYPWYITQVRNNLWSEWEKRRPVGVIRGAMVSFAIARDGKIKDLKIVKSSGDDSFDFSARSAVISAGPFPPLPMLYEKDLLTVTVEFKQEK